MKKSKKLNNELPRKFKLDMVLKPSLTLLLSAMVTLPCGVAHASDTKVHKESLNIKDLASYSTLTEAQQQVSGVVLDNNGLPLPGANVLEKGTANGTQTDFDGKFSITVSNENAVLVVSYLGFVSKEISLSGQTNLSVTLEEDASQLDEVVVTALGITREKKALGYAVQELSGDDIKNTAETNVVNALAGKSAGVFVNSSNGNVGASSRITIRGNQSLTGNNQPLFVVDGVPIDNSIVSSSRGGYDFTDMGNGAADINPSDIAEMTVLKGGNAAALYGSRGANGVILITTKSGKGKGFSVSVENSTTFSNPFLLPDYQNEYGQGGGQQFWYEDGLNGGKNDGVDESFGPRLDYVVQAEDIAPGGKLYWAIEAGFPQTPGEILTLPQFNSPVDPVTGERTPTPWVSNPDNIKNFYDTGITRVTNVSLTNGGEWGNMRLSITNSDQTGMVPNTDQVKNTINFSGKANLTDKLSFEAKGSFINSNGNLNGSGYTFNNIGMQTIWTARQVDWDYLKNNVENPDGTQISWISRWHNNPYWIQYKNLNPQTKNRFIGSSSIKYQFNDWLSLSTRAGIDYSNEQVELIRAYYGLNDTEGRYAVSNYFRQEINADVLLSAVKNITDDLSLTANLGANVMNNQYRLQTSSVNKLVVPNIYSLSNAKETPTTTFYQREKEIQSAFASVSLGYKSQLYLDLTGRNDWSSTLPTGNNSYFYPSATTSWIFSETFKTDRNFLSFGKARLSIAQVGNDTDPYRLDATYNASTPYGDNASFSLSSTMPAADLVNELITSKELGLDLKFLNNRIGLDLTLYQSIAKNQILSAPLTPTSGYGTQIINAGQVNNEGVELILTGTPIKTDNFSWDITANYAKNTSKIIALNGDVERLELYTAEGNQITVVAEVGGEYGEMWGKGFVYHENGKPIVDADGVPLTSDVKKLGNIMPDWLGGLNNSFSYKNFNLSVLIDAKMGGDVYSRTNQDGWATGALTSTVGLNPNGVNVRDPLEDGGGYLFDGVFEDGTPNTVYKDLDGFRWNSFARAERWLYDASYVKLRQITLSYSLPKTLISKLGLKAVDLSVFGRNLALLYKKNENFDPEVSNRDASLSSQGSEFASNPSARNVGFRAKFTF
ncbi:SusC/RagA family TonB-linked outer membrane protein [Arenibacter aquaticus]|uniref:SusC/RagA family TonB-linked outer membrane protein n=1 Tax=Arenibacter aquaticus TaxID=2489054 RepID=A0A430K4M7_9FLAO|nr:SusC/RagA family TonB-linked outer membrane protein [Arenibacter aquaticus]RTE53901.1 SusC/RagA family TonB-linked outer membrane protein [Arenibacter aquaticus]